jgi:membrane protease YdiL (CAAX protease family)
MIDQPEYTPHSADNPSARQLRQGDRFTIWSIAVIVLLVLYSLFQNNVQDSVARHFSKHKTVASAQVTTDAFQDLVVIDGKVKEAYVQDYMERGNSAFAAAERSRSKSKIKGMPATSFRSGIQDALDQSLAGLRGSPDSMYFARRIMLLRAVLGTPPLAPIPTVGKRKGMSSPLQAYELTAKETPDIARQAHQQERYWQSVFVNKSIPKSELPAKLADLRRHPTLLFYNLLASQYLYSAAGNKIEAAHIQNYIEQRSLLSMGGMVMVFLIAFSLFLVGVIVWVGGIFTVLRDSSLKISTTFFHKYLVPLPNRIENGERKLRAGDLLDCFAIYLLSLNGFALILEFVIDKGLHIDVKRMSDLQLIYWNIGINLAAYLGGSGLALLFLVVRARKLGASLSTELGLSTRNGVKNALYGAAGWGASLVLMVLVTLVAGHLLHELPDPENPALPLLAFAPNTISRFLLYGLAAIAAPFFEETFFRGVLLNALLLRFRPIYACLVTGLLFGSIHPVGIAEGLSLAALGAAFAWMAYLRKSLAPSMFAHFLQNSFAYLSVYFSFAAIFKF